MHTALKELDCQFMRTYYLHSYPKGSIRGGREGKGGGGKKRDLKKGGKSVWKGGDGT